MMKIKNPQNKSIYSRLRHIAHASFNDYNKLGSSGVTTLFVYLM